MRAAACLVAGDPASASGFVDIALNVIPEDRGMLPPTAMTKGDVLVAAGAIDDAVGWYERAQSLSQELEALSSQLIAATRLVQVAPTPERVEALDAICCEFTEGRGYPILAAAEQALAGAREALGLKGPA